LVAAIMADAPLAEIISIVDQLEAVVDRQGEIPATVVAELRSAIDLMRGGQSSATVSALLAARSELTMPPH
jgi:rRNA-processing protein FCF1